MELLGRLAENGLLALLLTISLSGLFFIFSLYRDSMEKRLSEYKDTQTTIYKAIEEMRTTVAATISALKSGRGENEK